MSYIDKLFERINKIKSGSNEQLIEMANLRSNLTGINHYIWAGPPSKKHGNRIKVVNEPGRIDPNDSFSVSVSDDPKIVAGIASISGSELNKVFEFVKKNKDVLIRHAEMKIDDEDLKANLKKV